MGGQASLVQTVDAEARAANAAFGARLEAWLAPHVAAGRVRALPDAIVSLAKPVLRRADDLSWEQAIAMEELAEPMCFTTAGHKDAVGRFLAAHR